LNNPLPFVVCALLSFYLLRMSTACLVLPGEPLPTGESATVAGAVQDGKLLNNNRVYQPRVGDVVLGVIVHKTAEIYRVDIGSPVTAILSNVAFNAATKRHKPTLALGAPVVCYVTLADPQMDTELSCEDKTTQRDWSSGETLFGALSSSNPAMLIDVSLPYAASLQASAASPALASLGRLWKFEIAVGVNGKVWVAGNSRREVLGISKVLTQAVTLTPAQVEALARAVHQNLEQK